VLLGRGGLIYRSVDTKGDIPAAGRKKPRPPGFFASTTSGVRRRAATSLERPPLPAVDDDARSRDPARPRAQQERDDLGDFLGPPEAPPRQLVLEHLLDEVRVLLRPPIPRTARKQDRPRRHRVDSHLELREIDGHLLREPREPGLGRDVRRARAVLAPADRAHVDDRAAAVLAHP